MVFWTSQKIRDIIIGEGSQAFSKNILSFALKSYSRNLLLSERNTNWSQILIRRCFKEDSTCPSTIISGHNPFIDAIQNFCSDMWNVPCTESNPRCASANLCCVILNSLKRCSCEKLLQNISHVTWPLQQIDGFAAY